MFDDLVRLEGRLLKEGRTKEASAIRSLLMIIVALDTDSQLKDKSTHEWMTYEMLEEYAKEKWTSALRAWANSQSCAVEELSKFF